MISYLSSVRHKIPVLQLIAPKTVLNAHNLQVAAFNLKLAL